MNALSPAMRGLLLALLAGIFFQGLNATARQLSGELPPLFVAWGRWALGFVCIAPFLLRSGFAAVRTRQLHLHGLRALFHGAGYGVWYSAVALIRVVGAPACIAPLVSMVAHPHPDPAFRYFGPDHALKCGGVAAIKPVVLAMPDVPYDQKRLEGSVILAISNISPREAVLEELRDLLVEKSRMARWVASSWVSRMPASEWKCASHSSMRFMPSHFQKAR